MAFCSTFNTDEARSAKVFPTFERNPVNHETFLSLNFCHLRYISQYILYVASTGSCLCITCIALAKQALSNYLERG